MEWLTLARAGFQTISRLNPRDMSLAVQKGYITGKRIATLRAHNGANHHLASSHTRASPVQELLATKW
eukprot:11227019-Lingulodinium_polyedra.AAC.1